MACCAKTDMSNGPVKPLTLTVQRGNEQFDRTLLAKCKTACQPTNAIRRSASCRGRPTPTLCSFIRDPLEQIKTSAGQIFNTIGALFARKSEIGVQQLGGAVMIARVYYNLFQDEDGWRRVLWFSVILNVNLALLNLLPLPVLDGGHITLSLIECRPPPAGERKNFDSPSKPASLRC
jgi:hypothetical protein